jgi:hypothetical protein
MSYKIFQNAKCVNPSVFLQIGHFSHKPFKFFKTGFPVPLSTGFLT